MSTNQERRAEARQRLREQMEAQARREKQLKIAGAAVVAVSYTHLTLPTKA